MQELQTLVFEGTSAKQTLVTANLRLVNSLVNKYGRRSGRKMPAYKMQDLMQEGVFGLLRAAEKFDGDKGFRFSTYATYWVTVSHSLRVGKVVTSDFLFCARIARVCVCVCVEKI